MKQPKKKNAGENAGGQNLILAIECTAHTFGAAVTDIDYSILSNERDILRDEKGGLIPIRILEHHIRVSQDIIQKALDNAKVRIEDIWFIAVSNSPGMGHALRSGNVIAKALSASHNIPIIPVNHSLSHLTSAMVKSKGKRTTLMYAAGANTQIYNYSGGRLMLVGETLDIGIGHLLDIVARELGYGFPGGPKIESLASGYKGSSLIELPYNVKGMDVVFGGMFTKIKTIISENKDKGNIDEKLKQHISASLQEYSFAALLEATERAAALNQSENIGIIGGVALNRRFQGMAAELCRQRNVNLIVPDTSLLADNAAMIGLEAARQLKYESSEAEVFANGKTLKISPYERLGSNFGYNLGVN